MVYSNQAVGCVLCDFYIHNICLKTFEGGIWISLGRKCYLLDCSRGRLFWVVFLWLIGLLLASLFILKKEILTDLRDVCFVRLKFSLFLTLLCLPIVLTYLMFRFGNFYFILPIVFAKAFLFASCMIAIRLSYGGAGWLLGGFLMLSDQLVCCILLCLWCYCACRGENVLLFTLYGVFGAIIIGSVQYYIISPFIDVLIKF